MRYRIIPVTLLLCVLFLTTAVAQPIPPLLCDDDACPVPWNEEVIAFQMECTGSPSCSVYVTANYSWRVGCTANEAEVQIWSYKATFQGGENCLITCGMADVLAKTFAQVIAVPPNNFLVFDDFGEGSCNTVVKLSLAHCYGFHFPVGGTPTWRYCSDKCCWTKYKVCRVGNENVIVAELSSGNYPIQVDVCVTPPDTGPTANSCEKICEVVAIIIGEKEILDPGPGLSILEPGDGGAVEGANDQHPDVVSVTVHNQRHPEPVQEQ